MCVCVCVCKQGYITINGLYAIELNNLICRRPINGSNRTVYIFTKLQNILLCVNRTIGVKYQYLKLFNCTQSINRNTLYHLTV